MHEKWMDFYSTEDIRKIQNIELNSLTVFEEICKKLNIPFYLYGGTMLGAVKYNGFVPWDDDLDLALMRDDYELLIREGSKLLPKEYQLQHPCNNKVTPFPYLKFRRVDTKLVEYPICKLNMNHGVYFDIYPIDNIPDDNTEFFRIHRKVEFWRKLFYFRQIPYLSSNKNTLKSIIKLILRKIIYFTLHLIPHAVFIKRMHSLMIKYNDVETQRQGNYYYPKPVNYYNGIEPSIEVLFEGRTLLIPRGYKVNLFNRYGDISKLPPKEERVGHKPFIFEI